MTPPRVCVLGSLNMDIIVRAERLPMPGETVLGRGYNATPGGKGANQALAASRLGAIVTLIGSVGDDPHGAKLKGVLAAEGIDLRHVRTQPAPPEGQPTGLGLITVAEGAGGENTIVVAAGANAAVRPEDVRAAVDAITGCDCLLLQLELPMQAVLEAVRLAASAPGGRRPIILNASPARQLPLELLKHVDVIVVNRAEAQVLTGMDQHTDPARLAFRVAEFGPPTVVLTLGPQGSVLCHRGRPKRIPTIRVTAIDTVGAGDAFAGALAAGWSTVRHAIAARSQDEHRLLDAALVRASVAGALATTRKGAIPAMPTASEVDARVGDLAGAT